MFDPQRLNQDLLAPVLNVAAALSNKVPDLDLSQVMLVGAVCRDLMHDALGHSFGNRPTYDMDLALGIASWATFDAAASAFREIPDSGIRFSIADVAVDLMPFGAVEEPPGWVEPPRRGETLSVWSFNEIHAGSLALALSDFVTIRIPTVPGFAAAKLGAWLDRAPLGQYKDATDLAVILYWYAESESVRERLYGDDRGRKILQHEEFHGSNAAAHLLGTDIANLIGNTRQAELLDRWPFDGGLLSRELSTDLGTVGGRWPRGDAKAELIAALTRGLQATPTLPPA